MKQQTQIYQMCEREFFLFIFIPIYIKIRQLCYQLLPVLLQECFPLFWNLNFISFYCQMQRICLFLYWKYLKFISSTKLRICDICFMFIYVCFCIFYQQLLCLYLLNKMNHTLKCFIIYLSYYY